MKARSTAPAPAGARRGYIRSNSVARALAAVGDRWSLLILAAAFQGTKRFEEWRQAIGISSNILTNRLQRLVRLGALRRVAVAGSARRHEYRLTQMGADFYPTALMFWRFDRLWSRRRSRQPATLTHAVCGKVMSPTLACAHCRRTIHARNVRYREGPGAGFERMPPPKHSRRSAVLLDSAGLSMLVGESVDIIGDRWTHQVLSTFFVGARRFEEIRVRCGVATNILSERLKLLVEHGLLQRRVCTTSPRHREYVLTPKGMDVYPIVLTLMKWGDRWLAGRAGAPLLLFCGHCNQALDPVVLCDQCGGTLDPHQVDFRRS